MESPLSDDAAKLILYEAFVEGELEAPKQLLSSVHTHYFTPGYKEFSDRSLWSLSNAFTSAFKDLKPISQYKATAKLSPFLQRFALPSLTPSVSGASPPILKESGSEDEHQTTFCDCLGTTETICIRALLFWRPGRNSPSYDLLTTQ